MGAANSTPVSRQWNMTSYRDVIRTVVFEIWAGLYGPTPSYCRVRNKSGGSQVVGASSSVKPNAVLADAEAEVSAALDIYNSVFKQLECPVCLDTSKPPLFMCVNGHNICSKCKTQIVVCPVCRAPGSPGCRNMALEALYAIVLLPCKFIDGGCSVKMNNADLLKHYTVCDYRFHCLMPNCTWFGKRTDLFSHSQENHTGWTGKMSPEPKIYSWGCYRRYNSTWLRLFQLDNEVFWVHFRYVSEESNLYFYCQYIGPKKEAENYKFKLTILSAYDDMQISLTGPTLSLEDNYRTNTKTFLLSKESLQTYLTDSGRLRLKPSIWKTHENLSESSVA